MKRLNHPNCVKFYELYEDPKRLCLVLELLVGGELFDRIVAKGSFSEHEASRVTRTIIDAVAYMHNNEIVHRDLKPENLIYATKEDSSMLKVTDFGLAHTRSASSKKQLVGKPEATMTTACGTPSYVGTFPGFSVCLLRPDASFFKYRVFFFVSAPEVVLGRGYNKQVDMWSIGVILYVLLCGFPPFYHESTAGVLKLVRAKSKQPVQRGPEASHLPPANQPVGSGRKPLSLVQTRSCMCSPHR